MNGFHHLCVLICLGGRGPAESMSRCLAVLATLLCPSEVDARPAALSQDELGDVVVFTAAPSLVCELSFSACVEDAGTFKVWRPILQRDYIPLHRPLDCLFPHTCQQTPNTQHRDVGNHIWQHMHVGGCAHVGWTLTFGPKVASRLARNAASLTGEPCAIERRIRRARRNPKTKPQEDYAL
jgi:hypothetical protein